MKAVNQLGIWMDHASAHLIEFSNDSLQTVIIESEFTQQVKAESLTKGESHMHSKEQKLQSEYYQALGDTIRKYDEVVIFGPSNAKIELLNTLTKDHHFDGIKIEIIRADSMTENQEQAFVREHFSPSRVQQQEE